HGEVGVTETGSDDRVAVEIAEVVDDAGRVHGQREDGAGCARASARIAHRFIEPLRRRSDNRRITDEVGPYRIDDTGERAARDHEIHRTARLRLRDNAQLPALHDTVALERQIVNRVD